MTTKNLLTPSLKMFSFVCLVGVLSSVITVRLASPTVATPPSVPADSLARIMAAKKLRCGYITYAPYLNKDPNTGAVSGLMVDVMTNITQKMGVTLEWSVETTWATMFDDMKMGRFDAFCSSVWQNTTRAAQADFSVPILYAPIQAWVRGDDTRFDGNLMAINNANVTIPTLDGEMVEKIAAEFFPQAKTISLPQNALFTDMLTNIVTKKADVVFLEPQLAQDYLRANPNSIRAVANVANVSEFPVVIAFPPNSPRLKTVIDTALMEMKSTPTLNILLEKYHMTNNVMVK